MSTRFVQGFDVEVQARFLSLCLVNILPLMFCRGYEVEPRDAKARFSQNIEF